MKPLNWSILLLSIVLFLSGCGNESMKNQEMTKGKINKMQIEPLKGPISKQDQDFIQAVLKSAASAEEMMGELEAALQEMEAHDEWHEASEMMEEAKKDILFLWNKMHNEYQPDHPELMKLKEYYEGILLRYRQGMSLEMEGMESGDTPKMKEGYETTGQAITDLRELAEQLAIVFQSR
ncbi:hypothetical protein [Robertmurraya sp.]|uniref:hypothetical protein n=1 Tax=Robertmurraya sp. TaxID=2837525 RepID=UPI003703B756